MRHLAVIAAASLLLLGCTKEQLDDTFAIACTAVSTADAGFQIYATSGKVSRSTIDRERKAVLAAQSICSGPRPTNVQQALAAVNTALAAIATATSEARAQTVRRRT